MSPGSTLDLFTLHCLYVFICWIFYWVILTAFFSTLKLFFFRSNSIQLASRWFMVFLAYLLPLENYFWSLPLKYHCLQSAKEVCFDNTLCSCLDNCFEGLYNCSLRCLGVPSSMNAVIVNLICFLSLWRWNIWMK